MPERSSLVVDAWIREAQEVSRLVEDIENRVKNTDLQLEHRIKDYAKSKVLEVGVKLDRLESLLFNPPSKPILSLDDMEFRWKMLSDFRLRSKALALILYAPPSTKRDRDLPANTKGTNISANNDQDDIQPFYSKDEQEMLKPLISQDATDNVQQMKQSGSLTPVNILRMLCFTILLILGAAVLVFILVILCALI